MPTFAAYVAAAIAEIDSILELLTDEIRKAIPDAPLNHLTTAYGIMFDKKRLLEGKTTQNNASAVVIRYEDTRDTIEHDNADD